MGTHHVDEDPHGVPVLDLHLPVVAVRRNDDGSLETPKPVIYGTAFPILPGVFVTAGHVATDACADGIPALVRRAPDGQVKVFQVTQYEVFAPTDLALLACPGLAELVPLPIDFDNQLTFFDPVYTVGFPCGVDPEWVKVVPRGFKGYVVTRRRMYQLSGQPPGYEVSFHAPQGLSGAPLVSRVRGDHRCYGYIIQEATIGAGQHETVVGIAIDVTVLLSIRTDLQGIGPLARAFGREPVDPRPPSPAQLPGGIKPQEGDTQGWPDDEPPPPPEMPAP